MSAQGYQNMGPQMASTQQMPQLQQALNNQSLMQKFSPGVGTLQQQPSDTYMSRPRYSGPNMMGMPQAGFQQQPTMMPNQMPTQPQPPGAFGNFASHIMPPTSAPNTQGITSALQNMQPQPPDMQQPAFGLSARMPNSMIRPQVR